MKYTVATTFRVVAHIEVDAGYPTAAKQYAEQKVRDGIEAFLPRCGVAFDETQINHRDGDD